MCKTLALCQTCHSRIIADMKNLAMMKDKEREREPKREKNARLCLIESEEATLKSFDCCLQPRPGLLHLTACCLVNLSPAFLVLKDKRSAQVLTKIRGAICPTPNGKCLKLFPNLFKPFLIVSSHYWRECLSLPRFLWLARCLGTLQSQWVSFTECHILYTIWWIF